MLKQGDRLQGRYHILRRIGGGGFGTVYLAEDTRLPGRRCAVKEMSPAQVPAQDRNWAIGAFKQEAEILARLSHPGIATVTDFFAERGNWYLVMEYVQGETLEQTLDRSPRHRLPYQKAMGILSQLCQVLGYLHAQNPPIIFRDLKPGNVMLTPEGEVKLIDFGIARFFKPGGSRDTVNLGTPGYAAPEQYGGRGQSDVRADVYGLGVLLHQMLTGYDPTSTPFRLPPVESLNPAVPPQVSAAIQRATEKDPRLRFASIEEFRKAIIGQTSVLPLPNDTGIPRWLIASVMGGFACMLLAASLVVGYLVINPRLSDLSAPIRTVRPAPSDTPVSIVKVVTATPQPGGTATPQPGGTATPVVITRVTTATPEPSKTPMHSPSPSKTPTRTPSKTPTRTSASGSGSPLPNQIVYACGSVGDADICILNISSGHSFKVVSHPADDTEPDWSPDRQQIVFQSNRSGSYDLFVTNARGTSQVNLTSTSSRDERGPDWSPDGSQIVYEVGDGRNNGELWVMNADGNNQRRLLDRSISGRAPTWSPDGRRIAFMRQDSSGYWQIYVLDLSSGSEIRLRHGGEHCRFPNWSPDGRYIVYNTYDLLNPRGQTYDVWRVPANGDGNPVRLTHDGDGGRPSWSPDGQSIVYNHGNYLYVMSADAKSLRRLSESENGWAPDW